MKELVKLFNATTPSIDYVDFIELNAKAMKRGYFVMPDACNPDVEEYIDSLEMNPNSTFYKSFEDVISKTRLEIFFDQMLHYATTYGADFNLGNGYVPNSNPTEIEVAYKDYKIISCISEEEMYEKCMRLLESGIALKEFTVKALCDFVCSLESGDFHVEIDRVNNKEALIYICNQLGVVPTRKFDLLRYILYITTHSTLLIKSNETIDAIKQSDHKFDFNKLSENQLNQLASIFYRFKPIFLAFKADVKAVRNGWRIEWVTVPNCNAPVINRIRRKAVKFHEPLPVSVESTMVGTEYDDDTIYNAIDKMTTYKLISVCNTINAKLNQTGESNVYLIRNGKMFIKEYNAISESHSNYLVKLFNIIIDEIVARIRPSEDTYVVMPKDYELACPTSEKNFIGNLPFGSYYDIENDGFFGVYWRNEWGTHDFDLSFVDTEGCKVGWNRNFKNADNSVLFSGDMTDAEPEATEVLYFTGNIPNGTVYVNRYDKYGADKYKFRIFLGKEHITDLYRSYMVNPANIKLKEDCTSDSREKMIGFIIDRRYYVADIRNSNKCVSTSCSNNDRFASISHKTVNQIMLNDILKLAGYNIVYDANDIPGDKQFYNIKDNGKEEIIKLFA